MRKKPIAIVMSEDSQEGERISNLFKDYEDIDFDNNISKERERIGKGGQVMIGTDLNSNSSHQVFARKMQEEEPNCARMLFTSPKRLVRQYKEQSRGLFSHLRGKTSKGSLLSMYFSYKGEELGPEKVNWDDFRVWFRKNYPTFHDIIIEDRGKPLKTEFKSAMDYVREEGFMFQPITVSLDGLGAFNMGTIEKLVRGDCVSYVYPHSDFVEKELNGDYDLVFNSLDLSRAERDKIITGTREEIFDTEPDVFIIARGKHGIDYSKFKTRVELIEMLLKTSIPKIDPILDKAIDKEYTGLMNIQSNPTGHLLYYAIKRGMAKSQVTSFPPDTIRHISELCEQLREFDPSIKEDDIELEAIGEHMIRGGTPLYYNCKVRGKPLMKAFPQMKDKKLQEIVRDKADKGLLVMQSAEKFKHDYRGVPERARECLSDIAHYKEFSRYPIYTGVLSCPAKFIYKGKGDNTNVRVQPIFTNISDLTKGDKEAEAEIKGDIKKIVKLTKQYLK
jgi:hypothetical protein